MFANDDEKYLIRLLCNNKVILFLGAGFSFDAFNCLREKMPAAKCLAEKIWKYLGYSDAYDGTTLGDMYMAFLCSPKSNRDKKSFLQNNLMCPNATSDNLLEIYNYLSIPLWYKIYTTNIDNIIDLVYKRTDKQVKNVIYPDHEFKERDALLDKTQVVYLHGKLPCEPDNVIFSKKQYARAALQDLPLYREFVRDYASMSTVFLGTDLNEPLFEQYIEARKDRNGYNEQRPKSFIICPGLSPVRADNFRKIYNVHYIDGTTRDFLLWLKKIAIQLPTKEEVLRVTFPNYYLIKAKTDDSRIPISEDALSNFSQYCELVPSVSDGQQSQKSQFLIGAEPVWSDIFDEIDIPRTICQMILQDCLKIIGNKNKNVKQKIIGVGGSAGSGKTTIIKRLAITLSREGVPVFYSNSEGFPRLDNIYTVLCNINQRVILIFDNAKNMLSYIPDLISDFSKLNHPPLLILSLRTNHLDRLESYLDNDTVDYSEYIMPDLDDIEIKNLINKLDHYNLLGILKGANEQTRFEAFKIRAQKQILVAMKEATKGKKFEEIMNDEYNEIVPNDAKFLCLCIALCTEPGFTLSLQDILSFDATSSIAAQNYLKKNLRGIVLSGMNGDRYMVRHRVVADYIISYCATPERLKDAYIRVLSGLSAQLLHGNTNKFNLFKALINHKAIFDRFKNNMELARDVYESISSYFANNAHFWLQYGSLEIEGINGNLELAENYINQAESLSPNNTFIITTHCLLYYKQSTATDDENEAYVYKREAENIAIRMMKQSGKTNPHIYHVVIKGRLEFVIKWISKYSTKKQELQQLVELSKEALSIHPHIAKLKELDVIVNKTYLSLGIAKTN